MPETELDVLLIEDNPGDVRLIQELLSETTGQSSSNGGRGSTGVRHLEHVDQLDAGLQRLTDERFDVVLLDLGLPGSTGIDTLQRVRDHSPAVPIVVLTGLRDETVGLQAVQHGAQEYLVKDELAPTLLQRSLQHAIERKKFERTQRALHDASRNVIQAESKKEISQLILDAAVDVLDLSEVAIYLFEDSSNELKPAAYTEYMAETFGGMPSFGPNNPGITWKSFITNETMSVDNLLESEHAYRTDLPFRKGLWIPLGGHGVTLIVTEEDIEFDQQTMQLADHLAATAEAALDRVEREESLREHERELTAQNSKLEDLNRLNELIREIDQSLVQATTRDAIEQAVCEHLTQDDRYAFAWIGEVVSDERLNPRAWAGTGHGYLDAISLSMDDDNPSPAVSAASTGTSTVVTNVAADLRSAPWRKAALANGLQSVISVPLTYNDVSYGTLTVFADEPEVIDERTKEVTEELGETIANAINSVETRRALLTDTVVELELTIQEPDDLLLRIAREADCQIEYGGTVPQSDGTTRIFFSTVGASVDDVRSVVEDVPSIRRIEHLGETDDEDENRFEVVVAGPTIPSTLVECGAVPRSIRVAESEIQVVVELPGMTDVRTFIDRLERSYPDTELIARRDKERTAQSTEALETALTDELTERQLEALQTAYRSGYFEWPRERTGVEVAESLGITQPTLNGHLRAAERKLCAMLFDAERSPE